MKMLNLKKINKLVVEYFNGDLMQLKFNYVSQRVFRITVRYASEHSYLCEYQVEVNDFDDVITYCFHTCQCQLEVIKLFQVKAFEDHLASIIKAI
jgi:hypothetical protein